MAFLFRLLSFLPLPMLHNLGAVMGWVTWLASPTYRRHLNENITLAGFRHVRNAAVAEAGKAAAELPKIWLRPKEELLGRIVQVSGWEHVEAARAAGRGVIILTPHIGCFEIVGHFVASHMPITTLYRRPRQAWLAPLMEEGRGRAFKLAPADTGGVRRLIRALRQGESIGILPDQVPGNGEGIWAPFFGRPAFTMTLAVRLAETGAAVVYVVAERLHYGAGYRLHFQPLSAPFAGDLKARVLQMNQEAEANIRVCPEQYLWGYNRYKKPSGAPDPE